MNETATRWTHRSFQPWCSNSSLSNMRKYEKKIMQLSWNWDEPLFGYVPMNKKIYKWFIAFYVGSNNIHIANSLNCFPHQKKLIRFKGLLRISWVKKKSFLCDQKPPRQVFHYPGDAFTYTGPDRNWETRGAAAKMGGTEACSSWFGASTLFTNVKEAFSFEFYRLLISGNCLCL